MVHIWTSADRFNWVTRAVTSQQFKGVCGPYVYKAIPKLVGNLNEQDDPRKSRATDALADVIYNSNPVYRSISLALYSLILDSVNNNAFLRLHMNNFRVVVKGGNAYAMLVPNCKDLPYSDLDIVIMINPNLPDALYDQLRNTLRILTLQCLSRHKKMLDNMFFSENPDPELKYKYMNDENIEQFKQEHIIAMESIGLISPFVDHETRNLCSRNSFLLTQSKVHGDKIMKIETPHFEMCDRIPLRKSPLFCSFNDTIKFEKDGYVRDFELSRIKMNNLHVDDDSVRVNLSVGEDEKIKLSYTTYASPRAHYDKVQADFIDVSICGKYDTENIDFWQHGRCLVLLDRVTMCWVMVPDVHSCMRDLWKMLHVYDCPEHKRSKRMRKLEVLGAVLSGKYVN